jgi:hypothetical protein
MAKPSYNDYREMSHAARVRRSMFSPTLENCKQNCALVNKTNHTPRPKNGRNITTPMFVSALTDVYNVDPSFAERLAKQGLDGVPHAEAGPSALNLADLDKHNAIEHDASLTRLDDKQGDNHSVQPKLVAALLADSSTPFLTIESLAKSRARREKESQASGSPSLSVFLSTLAHGEAALLLQVLGHLGPGKEGEYLVPKAAAQTWLQDEQLPAGWKRPPYVISLTSTLGLSAKVVAAKDFGGASSAVGGLLGGAVSGLQSLADAVTRMAKSYAGY